jgi:hypothetical protein
MALIESQNLRIKKHLEAGRSLTALDGLYQFGTLRLGARIYDLRKQGMRITSETIEIVSACVPGKKYVARYKLAKPGIRELLY